MCMDAAAEADALLANCFRIDLNQQERRITVTYLADLIMQITEQQGARRTISHSTNMPRLPCRGCMPDCNRYTTCDGRPWRLKQEQTK